MARAVAVFFRTPQVVIADTIDGVPVTWTLGALLVLLSGQYRGDFRVHGAGGHDGVGMPWDDRDDAFAPIRRVRARWGAPTVLGADCD